jgi:hypothetical protein
MKITLSELKTKDLATLTNRILQASDSTTYPVLANHPLLTAIEAEYNAYDAVYSKQTYSGKGKDVAAADDARDAMYSKMKAFLNGHRQLESVPHFQEAEDLYQVFVKYGLDLDRQSYSSQSAQMKKLIEELEIPANTQKLALLSLQTAFNEMKTLQQDFETAIAEQSTANAELRQTDSASSIRKSLEQNLKAYLNFLTAMKNVPPYNDIYAQINELVKSAKGSK